MSDLKFRYAWKKGTQFKTKEYCIEEVESGKAVLQDETLYYEGFNLTSRDRWTGEFDEDGTPIYEQDILLIRQEEHKEKAYAVVRFADREFKLFQLLEGSVLVLPRPSYWSKTYKKKVVGQFWRLEAIRESMWEALKEQVLKSDCETYSEKIGFKVGEES